MKFDWSYLKKETYFLFKFDIDKELKKKYQEKDMSPSLIYCCIGMI